MKQILLILVFSNLIQAQQGFIKEFDLSPFETTIFNSIIIENDNLYITGIIADSIFPYSTGSLFIKFDLNGNIINASSLLKDDNQYETWFQSLQSISSNSFFTHGYNYSEDLNNNFLIEYNKFGDVSNLWEFKIKDDVIQSIPYDMTFSPIDTTFIFSIYGALETPEGNNNSYIYKFNTKGEEIWNLKENVESPRAILNKISMAKNGTFISGQWLDNSNLVSININNQLRLAQYDKDGNSISEYLSSSEEDWTGPIGGLISDFDNNIVFASANGDAYVEQNQSFERYKWNWVITKMDNNYNIIWSTKLNSTLDTLDLNDHMLWNGIETKNDSGYVFVGKTFENGPKWFYWIIKIDKNGKLQWERKINIDGLNNNYTLRDIVESDDNNLYIVGEALNLISGKQKGVLIKLNAEGCINENCDFLDSIIEIEDNLNINIFPNPTKDIISIDSKSRNITSIQLFSENGNIIKNKSYSNSTKKIILNLQQQCTGIYILKINSANGISTYKKIVLQN